MYEDMAIYQSKTVCVRQSITIPTQMQDWGESISALYAARAIDEIADHEGKLGVGDIATRPRSPGSHAERIINRLVKGLG